MERDLRPSKLTLAAVAAEVGVSAPTVSKVVNGREDVAEATRARVLAALQRTGYKSPLQRKSIPEHRAVEVVFDSLNSAYGVEVLNGVMEHAAVSDMEVILSITGRQAGSPLGPEERAQRLIDEGRAGMIVVTSAFGAAQLEPSSGARSPPSWWWIRSIRHQLTSSVLGPAIGPAARLRQHTCWSWGIEELPTSAVHPLRSAAKPACTVTWLP